MDRRPVFVDVLHIIVRLPPILEIILILSDKFDLGAIQFRLVSVDDWIMAVQAHLLVVKRHGKAEDLTVNEV